LHIKDDATVFRLLCDTFEERLMLERVFADVRAGRVYPGPQFTEFANDEE
jgi:hypothetical protein